MSTLTAIESDPRAMSVNLAHRGQSIGPEQGGPKLLSLRRTDDLGCVACDSHNGLAEAPARH